VDKEIKKSYVVSCFIEFCDLETEEVVVFLTNKLKLGATTIAAIYKDNEEKLVCPKEWPC
jgi:hypothetical protein